jgi:hypothetical protein
LLAVCLGFFEPALIVVPLVVDRLDGLGQSIIVGGDFL